IRMIDVLTALVTLFACVLGVLFLEVILDHAFGLPAWIRGIVLVIGLTLSGAYAAWRILWPLVRRVNSYYAAKTIESLDPHFKNSLITYLDLRKHREGLPKNFIAAVENKAVNDLADLEIDAVVDQRPLVKMTYALAAVVVLFCLYSLFTPKSILDSARRAFLADIARPTNTQLVNIKPGDDARLATVAAGTDVEISTEVRGKRPESISLHFSLDGGQFFARQELGRGPSDYDPWITTLRNVQPSQGHHEVLYYLTGGDAETRTYTLNVKPTPMVLEVSHDLQFPGYIEKEREKAGQPRGLEALDGGSVEAIEGTLVTVHARTNEPARSARLEFGKNSNGREKDSMAMDVNRSDPYLLTGQFRVEDDRTYWIRFESEDGQRNREPVIYDIRSLPDRSPSAQFVHPEPVVKVPANGKLALRMKATDDHGVKEMTLNVWKGKSDILQAAKNYLDHKDPTQELVVDDVLDVSRFAVKPGERFEYWLHVRDTKEPQSNRVDTVKQVVEVVEPLPPEEAKQQRDEQDKLEQQPPADQAQNPNPDQNTPQNPPPDQAQPPNPDQKKAQNPPPDQPLPPQDQPNQPQPRDQGADQADNNPRAGNDQNPPPDQPRKPDENLSEADKQKLRDLQRALNLSNEDRQPQPPPQNGEQQQPQQGAQGQPQPGNDQQGNPQPKGQPQPGGQGQNQGNSAPSNAGNPPPNGNQPPSTGQPNEGMNRNQGNAGTNSPDVERANPSRGAQTNPGTNSPQQETPPSGARNNPPSESGSNPNGAGASAPNQPSPATGNRNPTAQPGEKPPAGQSPQNANPPAGSNGSGSGSSTASKPGTDQPPQKPSESSTKPQEGTPKGENSTPNAANPAQAPKPGQPGSETSPNGNRPQPGQSGTTPPKTGTNP
ncbi:MAG TPA: hypothetical protein VFT74_19720, partial [Isosphaeraceae bacterium]|nr:hypothetical protein [Isosphaeraceae bacterium]